MMSYHPRPLNGFVGMGESSPSKAYQPLPTGIKEAGRRAAIPVTRKPSPSAETVERMCRDLCGQEGGRAPAEPCFTQCKEQYRYQGRRDAVEDMMVDTYKTAMNLSVFYMLLSSVGLGMGIYHGYKRDGAGGAVGYGLLGAIVPFIGIPVFFAQGYGKKG